MSQRQIFTNACFRVSVLAGYFILLSDLNCNHFFARAMVLLPIVIWGLGFELTTLWTKIIPNIITKIINNYLPPYLRTRPSSLSQILCFIDVYLFFIHSICLRQPNFLWVSFDRYFFKSKNRLKWNLRFCSKDCFAVSLLLMFAIHTTINKSIPKLKYFFKI